MIKTSNAIIFHTNEIYKYYSKILSFTISLSAMKTLSLFQYSISIHSEELLWAGPFINRGKLSN